MDFGVKAGKMGAECFNLSFSGLPPLRIASHNLPAQCFTRFASTQLDPSEFVKLFAHSKVLQKHTLVMYFITQVQFGFMY
jgi:hypothetical protein